MALVLRDLRRRRRARDILEGVATIDELETRLFDLILRVASGQKRAKNELNDCREIAI